jgi:hypothetical protein
MRMVGGSASRTGTELGVVSWVSLLTVPRDRYSRPRYSPMGLPRPIRVRGGLQVPPRSGGLKHRLDRTNGLWNCVDSSSGLGDSACMLCFTSIPSLACERAQSGGNDGM